MNFSKLLIDWYNANKRSLPWREANDAYKIWLSEIIMQQTRIEQGTSYYLKFVEHFPTVQDLAHAAEEEVLMLWQGLGYYSRARNLHATAKQIVNEFGGKFPQTIEQLQTLKGIGEYTAAAIASFAFNLPHPTIDGNVQRVLCRAFGLHEAINTGASKKELNNLAYKLIDTTQAATFNQALMDFGSIHCKAQNPLCNSCPFSTECYALRENKINVLPLKKKALAKQDRFLYYFIILHKENNHTFVYIKQRTEKDIWNKLYDFPLIDSKTALNEPQQLEILTTMLGFSIPKQQIKTFDKNYKHILSHQTLFATFYTLTIQQSATFEQINSKQNYTKINIQNILEYPFPKLIHNFFNDNQLV